MKYPARTLKGSIQSTAGIHPGEVFIYADGHAEIVLAVRRGDIDIRQLTKWEWLCRAHKLVPRWFRHRRKLKQLERGRAA